MKCRLYVKTVYKR